MTRKIYLVTVSRFDGDWNSIAEVVDQRVLFREFQSKIEVWLGDEHLNSGKKLDFWSVHDSKHQPPSE